MLQSSSNIRVYVHWPEQTVFSGEQIECQITFKNTAAVNATPGNLPSSNNFNGFVPGGERQRKASPIQAAVAQAKKSNTQNPRSVAAGRGHRPTLSLSAPGGNGRIQREARAGKGGQSEVTLPERSHRRSVSIISLGISENPRDEEVTPSSVGEGSGRPSRGHIRASSLQIVPRRSGVSGAGPLSAPFAHRSTTQPSPLFHTSAPADAILPARPAIVDRSSAAGRQSSIATVPIQPNSRKTPGNRRKVSASFPQNFRFPSPVSPHTDQLIVESVPPYDEIVSPHTAAVPSRLLSPQRRDDFSQSKDQTSLFTKVLSPTINGETPRSSGEFYSLSNNSTETLASEYLPQQSGRTQQQAIHARRISNITTVNQHRPPETLMMGYAQINGSFTLDGSLVNQRPFEEVKRKGVLGGQGGGVIGIETNKRDSGLLRNFGWANIGESLGGLLGGGELSSIKDMRGIASSKSVPLLSTPQSILFVNLRLAPGESRSYKYSFKLPRGLPPSHRGKAIKIVYNLVIGTQRPGGAKEQQVKSVDLPFRVLGSVNEHGELLGHDLMSPYIIMRDQARVQSVESTTPISAIGSSEPKLSNATHPPQSTLDDFLNYADDLLTRPRQNSSLGLLSPTEARSSRRASFLTEQSSARDAIDLAILRSNLATDSQQSANRFEVTREGRRVAVIMLARPAYRLGETITAAIEFTGAKIPCYAVHASLETSEKVDSAIALRSDATINRVTRKIHSSHSESTFFARRVIFSPAIPPTATPSFITSGVSLEWKILIEFVTPRFERPEDGKIIYGTELLDEISRDERGIILAASEGVDCESFEIPVPLLVYGALTGPVTKDDAPRGLVV